MHRLCSHSHSHELITTLPVEWAEHEAHELMSRTSTSKLVNSELSGVNTTIINSWNTTLKSLQKALAAPPRKES